MGLLDKARDETKRYIRFDTLVYYLAYFTDETLTEVIQWLSYHQDVITKYLHEYYILENLKIELNENYDISNFLIAIQALDKYGFFWQFDESEYNEQENFKSAFYFYYEIRQLNEFPIFKELGINFYNADNLSFILTQSTDKVTVSDKPPYILPNGKSVYYHQRKIKHDKNSSTDLGEFDENNPLASRIHYIFQSALNAKNEPSDSQTDHASTAELHERIAELEKQANDKKLDKRTENNLIRLLLVVNEWAKTNKDKNLLDTSKPYNKNDLEKINSTLDLLGYHQIGETAYKTLIELIKSKKSKGL